LLVTREALFYLLQLKMKGVNAGQNFLRHYSSVIVSFYLSGKNIVIFLFLLHHNEFLAAAEQKEKEIKSWGLASFGAILLFRI